MSGRDPDRRASILAAAIAAVDDLGSAVRMDEIAEMAGISKPVVYRHFDSKGGVYEAVARQVSAELLAELETVLGDGPLPPRDRLAGTIDTFLAAIERHPERYRFLLSPAAERPEVSRTVDDFTSQLARRLRPVIEAAYDEAGLTVDRPVAVAHALVGMAHQVGVWWLQQEDIARRDVRDLLVGMAWHGLPSLGRPV